MFNCNTWNHLTVCEQMIDIINSAQTILDYIGIHDKSKYKY